MVDNDFPSVDIEKLIKLRQQEESVCMIYPYKGSDKYAYF